MLTVCSTLLFPTGTTTTALAIATVPVAAVTSSSFKPINLTVGFSNFFPSYVNSKQAPTEEAVVFTRFAETASWEFVTVNVFVNVLPSAVAVTRYVPAAICLPVDKLLIAIEAELPTPIASVASLPSLESLNVAPSTPSLTFTPFLSYPQTFAVIVVSEVASPLITASAESALNSNAYVAISFSALLTVITNVALRSPVFTI